MPGLSGPPSPVVGRDPELHGVAAFIDQVESGPCALALEGSAGIGKTTIWLAGVDQATSRGYRVVQSRGAELEARLSYAALGDLLGDAPDAVYAGMPAPLRQALDAALLRAEAPGGSVDPRAVSLAAAHAFRNLAADAPLVVAIDDLQWIDGPSARVLSFVLRRVADERIGVLVSIRQGSGSKGDPVDLDRALTRTTHLAVGPLPLEPLGRILRDRTSHPLPRPDLARLHRITGGNPLFAIEMARAASSDGLRADPDGVWAVPEDLQQLLSSRLAALPASAHEPLLAIAATSQPTWELVLEIAGSSERTLEAPRPGRECRRHRAGERPGAVLASPAGVDRLREYAGGRTASAPCPARHHHERPGGTGPAPGPGRRRARPGGRLRPSIRRPGGPVCGEPRTRRRTSPTLPVG